MSGEHPTYNGRYEVQRRVARGGMADVFLARDLLLARPVAVKVLFPEFAGDPAFVARFRREAQAAANLNHPNIVGVYDWGQEGGTYYIVMEFIDGRSLSEILRTQGTPPARTAAGIAVDVAAALGFAHRNGVVHRDIKPGNIMITNSGHVKVADFGIARAITASAEDNLTQAGSVMGTATYFSPEQAQGHNVEGRSDLYSLGIVMYEMAHGKPPFVADSPIAVAYKHVQEAPPRLRAAHPEVPVGYEAITMRLLAKSADDRYADADALRADLRRFTEGQRVRATAPAAAGASVGARAAAVGVGVGGAIGAAGAADATGVVTTARRGRGPGPPASPSSRPVTPVPEAAASDEADHRRSRTGWFVLVLLVMLAVLGAMLFAFASTLGIGDEAAIEVPDVTDKPVTEARQILERAGFRVDPNPQREPSADVAADAVIRQDPAANTEADEGSTVTIVVSSGRPQAEQVRVPQVEGEPVAEALRILNADGFRAFIDRRQSETVAEGLVIEQSPSVGELADSGSRVEILLSEGPPPTTLPPPTDPPITEPPTTEPPTTPSTAPV